METITTMREQLDDLKENMDTYVGTWMQQMKEFYEATDEEILETLELTIEFCTRAKAKM
jgi:hypothetical protein